MTKFEEIVRLVQATAKDAEKSYDGVHSAQTRVRKAMQTLKHLAQDVRNEITELRKLEE